MFIAETRPPTIQPTSTARNVMMDMADLNDTLLRPPMDGRKPSAGCGGASVPSVGALPPRDYHVACMCRHHIRAHSLVVGGERGLGACVRHISKSGTCFH